MRQSVFSDVTPACLGKELRNEVDQRGSPALVAAARRGPASPSQSSSVRAALKLTSSFKLAVATTAAGARCPRFSWAQDRMARTGRGVVAVLSRARRLSVDRFALRRIGGFRLIAPFAWYAAPQSATRLCG